jgi:hypothetical protein
MARIQPGGRYILIITGSMNRATKHDAVQVHEIIDYGSDCVQD